MIKYTKSHEMVSFKLINFGGKNKSAGYILLMPIVLLTQTKNTKIFTLQDSIHFIYLVMLVVKATHLLDS